MTVAESSPGFTDSLSGLRVLDVSSNLAGPYCAQILADLDADVVKVERPGDGDPSRAWAPPQWGGDGTLFLASNRGKRSLALDLGDPGGAEILGRLVERADVVIQAFRPDVARRFGLTEERLRGSDPRLILCSITAFGHEGPDKDRPGYDPLVQARTGLMSVTGPTGGPPVRIGTSLVDMGAGMWAAMGVISALRVRDRTGEGTHVRVSLQDTGLAWGAYHLMGAAATGRAPEPMDTGLEMIAPYGAFPTSDGRLMIGAGNDALFERLCHALDLPEVSADPRFATNPKRVVHRSELEEILAEVTRRHSRTDLEQRLQRAGVPCAPIRDMVEVSEDPAVRSGAFRPEPHPGIPGYRGVALPPTWDGRRAPVRRPPPRVGEHTHEVLEEIGYGADEIETLRERGVIQVAPARRE